MKEQEKKEQSKQIAELIKKDFSEDIFENDSVIVSIEQVDDIEKWKPFLLEISSTPVGETVGYHACVVVNEERNIDEGDFMSEKGSGNTIEINMLAWEFIELMPRFRELDEDDMLSVSRTCQNLEDVYYEESEIDEIEEEE